MVNLRMMPSMTSVAEPFGALAEVRGRVERHDIPNLRGLNFILHDSLGGGGSASLKTDAQGKTMAAALLRMEIAVDD